MKPLIPVALVLISSLAGTARAQEGTAPVAATVAQNLVIASTGTTDFGTVGDFAHTEIIDASAPTGTQEVAQFTVTRSGTTIVSYSCSPTVTLTGPGGAMMTFTPKVTISGFAGGQATSSATPCPFANSQTELYMWLGGSLAVAASQAAGEYSGVFTLTAAYQ
jgi:Mat/Ecp fimbriae major subunit